MKESNMPRADFLMSIILMAFGISVLVISIQMPRFEEFGASPYSVPGIVPGFLGVLIAGLGFVLFLRSIIRKGYLLGLTGSAVKNWAQEDGTRRLLMTLGSCLIYSMVFIGWLPYPVGTVLFIFGFIAAFEHEKGVPLMKQKKMLIIALITALLSGLSIWAVFRYLFLVNLP